jgi:formylglycine-generating enzyme required for sulfatase activity
VTTRTTVYWIGKYEVTAGQYTTVLNAAAADVTNSLRLYNKWMWNVTKLSRS